jgi:hypothetical protein
MERKIVQKGRTVEMKVTLFYSFTYQVIKKMNQKSFMRFNILLKNFEK